MNAFDDISAELFARRYRVRFRAGGRSMYPAIRDGETITVEPAPASALAVGDIAFYRTRRGATAHRVVATGGTGKAFLMRGDALGSEIETVEPDWILGKVVAIERGGQIIDPASRKTKMTNFMLQCASRARRRALVMASYLLASLALSLVLCGPAHAAVAYVTSTSTGFTPTTTTFNWPVSLGSGKCTNNYLMVAVSSHHAATSAVTFAGRTLTTMGLGAPSGVGDAYVQVYYGALQTSDCTGSQTVTFTLVPGANSPTYQPGANTPYWVGLIVFSGTRGPGAATTISGPCSNTGITGGCPTAPTFPVTVSVTAPGTNGMVFDVLGVDNGQDVVTHGANQTDTWTYSQTSGTRTLTASASYHSGSANAVTMSENWTNVVHDGAYYLAGIQMLAGSPTLVKERTLSATAHPEGTLIEFSTGHEVSSLGFNLYREQNGQRIKLNESLLAGSALFAGPTTALTAGHSHSWLDQGAGGAASYWIEEVDINGERTWFGPTVVQTAAKKGSARLASAFSAQSQLLSHVGREGVQVVGVSAAGATRPLDVSAQASPDRAPLETQWSLAAGQAVKIAVRSEGWYRVSQADLLAAGLNPRVDPSTLQLYADGSEQPIVVQVGSAIRLGAIDSVEFYGVGMDTPWSGVRTYWLRAGNKPGLRVKSLSGRSWASGSAASFPFTIQWKPRTLYFAALLNGDSDNFFGPVLAADPVSQSLTVSQIYTAGGGTAQLKVTLQGAASGNHQVAVQINGTEIGQVKFSGLSVGTASFAVPVTLLKNGSNMLTLAAKGGDTDVSVVDTVLLTYPRMCVAEGNALRFTIAAGAAATITGFTSSQIRVMDITDPDEVAAVTGTVSRGTDGSYAVALNPPGSGTRTLLAFVNPTAVSSADVTANHPSSWHASGPGADMAIISHAQFLSALTPLKTLRESQGLSVALIDVEDLYDEFNYGAKSPYALRDFLETARSGWRSKPRFLLLVGDASYDPRGYLGTGDLDFVPTKLVDTAYLQTASDDWYADFQGDGLPQLAVGRLPVQTLDEAKALVSKIVGYEQSYGAGWRNRVVLVTGSNDSDNDFERQTATVEAALPSYVSVWTVDQGTASDAHGDLMNTLGTGAGLVNYIGHGSTQVWAGGLLNSTEAAGLTNSQYLPFYAAMTCLNGYFIDDTYGPSLAKALIMAPAGGAVAVWASSGLTEAAVQIPLDVALMKALYSNPSPTIGEAAAAAKKAVTNLDLRRTWVLLGDPATRLR